MQRKKDVATGVALPPESGVMYGSKPISFDYARVDMTWTNSDYDKDEINFPTTEGFRYMRGIVGIQVLWNKRFIILDVPTLASQRSLSSSSPSGDLGDDDDNSGNDNDNAGGPGSTPPCSLPHSNSNPQGVTG